MMLDTGILMGGKRTMNISWTRCLGLTRGRAAIASGRRARAVHGQAKGALAWVEASELCYGQQPVVRRCRSSAAEPHEPGRRAVGDRVSQPGEASEVRFAQRRGGVSRKD